MASKSIHEFTATTLLSTSNLPYWTPTSPISCIDLAADKETRKREYNRLGQREFGRRRKEHLKKLEENQKEKSTEHSEDIERVRYQNDELRRENEFLRPQIYGSSMLNDGR